MTKLTFCQMTQNRLPESRACIEKVLPFVDRVILIDGGSSDDSIFYFRNWAEKEPKIEFYLCPWKDNFSEQRNNYLSKVEDNSWCFDDQTELLTDEGWKFFKDLNQSELVLTINPVSKELEYQKPTNYIHREYSGPIVSYESKSTNFCATIQHRMYLKMNESPEYEFLTLEEVLERKNSTASYLEAGIWYGNSPTNEIIPGISNINLMKILGWYISEGWSYSQGFRHKIQMSQTKEPYRSEIIQLIKDINRSPIFEKKKGEDAGTITFYHKPLFDWLQQFGKNAWSKKLNKEIKSLSTELLSSFIETYMKGDGSGGKYWHTTSEALANDLQEIFIKLNKRCSFRRYERKDVVGGTNKKGQKIVGRRPCFVGTISEMNEGSFETKALQTQEYSGFIYCVAVPNSTLCTRRKNKVMFSGNCLVSDPDEQFEQVALESLQQLISKAEELNKNMIGFQCRSVSMKGPYRVHESLDNYYKRLLFKKLPGTHYVGNPHEHLKNHPHRILDTKFVYEHIKQENITWHRGLRNMYTGGGGPNLGASNPRWVDLRNITTSLGINTWHDFDKYLMKGNIDQRVKDWMIKYHDTDGWDGASEHREAYKTYFLIYHPEEIPQELRGKHIP